MQLCGLRHVQTGAAGYYEFAVAQVGAYKLRVEKQGFQAAVSELTLDVGQRARFDITLSIGSSTQSVTVEATAPLLSTEDAKEAAIGAFRKQNAAQTASRADRRPAM